LECSLKVKKPESRHSVYTSPQLHNTNGFPKSTARKTKNESVFFDYSVLAKKVLVDIIHFTCV